MCLKLLILSIFLISCNTTTEPADVYGCTISTACNFNSSATVFDDSCIYELDCSGECGGSAAIDVCNVCGGNVTVASDCDDVYGECPLGMILGCNGICASNPSLFDECGVCGGDGSSCSDCQEGNCNPYDWEDCPSCFSSTASLLGAVVYSNGILITSDPNDILAVFNEDNNVRGIAQNIIAGVGPYGPDDDENGFGELCEGPDGCIIHEMQIRGNGEDQGSTYHFLLPLLKLEEVIFVNY